MTLIVLCAVAGPAHSTTQWRQDGHPDATQLCGQWPRRSRTTTTSLDNVPSGALDLPDRWSFLRQLYRATPLERPDRDAGLLPYHILELYQPLEMGWRLWRAASDTERPWIEERIVNDAGLLGHYVADAAQPHHTSVHYDGWAAGVPNPEGYTTERGFHSRFEAAFVGAHVTLAQLQPAVRPDARVFVDVSSAIHDHILDAYARVEELYRLDRDFAFDPVRPPAPETRRFAIERLAVGATMLRRPLVDGVAEECLERHSSATAPGRPASTMNRARVSSGALGSVTQGTTRKSAVSRSGVASQLT